MFDEVVSQLPAEIIEQFRRALETGRWANGAVLTEKQKQICSESLLLKTAMTTLH